MCGENMVNFLRKHFIKDYNDIKKQKVREAHGKLASFVGVLSNLVLFIIKLLAGLFSKSVSIIADSINNLSDMGSSIVTLIGFKMANKPADEEHPYGHERMEYISGLIVAIIIMFVGGSLFFTSIDKIIHYEYVDTPSYISYITIGILCVSILIKLWQSMFNKKIGKLIGSVALEATACDSRNDVVSTSVILLGTILIMCLGDVHFSIDGILGILVSIFIVISGIKLIKETIDPLLGSSVSKDYVDEVIQLVKRDPIVLGIHDVMCHMYGPTKCFMTLHAEVDSSGDIINIHDHMDSIESNAKEEFGVDLTIHMDPIVIGDEETNRIHKLIGVILKRLDENLTFHDFRVVRKHTKSTLLFDVVVPYKYHLTNQDILDYINHELNSTGEDYGLIVNFDHQFIKNTEVSS